jgi:hypothetical protein
MSVARPHLDEADAALDEPAGEQAPAAKVGAHRIVEAVELLRRFGLVADVGGFRRRHLHAEGEFVGLEARGKLRVVVARLQVPLVDLRSV